MQARGKFLFASDEKLHVRGVTYGAFRPDEQGKEYTDLDRIELDFAQMVENGINAVRIPHTTPPPALLDVAQRHGLRVMVGVSAESDVGFLADGSPMREIEARIRARIKEVAGHPALLCYSLGNEIPASLVRWIGHRRVERYLRRLYRVVKKQDAEALVTYVNYPSTEYLELAFLDLISFNVYLENPERLAAYIPRLHNIAGDRPLLLTEVGLDSLRHGEPEQADALDWQIHTAFASGCAGLFVFSWTDDWFRAGSAVEDWAFGLTRRDRSPKPALASVRHAFGDVPFPKDMAWPRISVVVCTYNGAERIEECLENLARVEYPDYEVIVVVDGSNDRTAEIVGSFANLHGFRTIFTENRGLASARNTGLSAATGEIVAYIDDDAYPDPHWLTYLAGVLRGKPFVGVGGPNIPPDDDGMVARCVAGAPGGPIHVLLTDDEAEHIPGCNMAFRKSALEAIGGFDPRFRVAGDDVDVCWRLQDRGWKLGFSPGAVVWHHRRNSIRAYWRQQRGYGKAEALLEAKWPDRYNGAGHPTWAGRVYGNAHTRSRAGRIYFGIWGRAPFQSVYRSPGLIASLPTMPEWYLLIAILAVIAGLGFSWTPLLFAVPIFAGVALSPLVLAAVAAGRAPLTGSALSRFARLRTRLLIAVLHLGQPLARLAGRLRHGLTPWRRHSGRVFTLPRPLKASVWSERWRAPDEWIGRLREEMASQGALVFSGGDFDRWDLEVRAAPLASVRTVVGIEEHGGGTQFVRVRAWPRLLWPPILGVLALASLSTAAGLASAIPACGVLGGLALLFAVHLLRAAGAATAVTRRAIERWEKDAS